MSNYNMPSFLSRLGWDPYGLESVSNTLNSILEQGILLEHVLISHKNRILEKKANRANFNKDSNESVVSEPSRCSEENRLNNKSVNNTVQNQTTYSINEMDKSETESHTSNSDSVCANKALDGLVKLVYQKQLLDLNVSSAVSMSYVKQFVTASTNALNKSLLSSDDNLIQSELFTSCEDGAIASGLIESDLQESEGTNLSNVNKYSNSLTQDNQNISLPHSIQNKNSPNALLPFNCMSIKIENDLPVMPSPISVKSEQNQEDSGLSELCLQLNITNQSSHDIDNAGSTVSNGLDPEAVISVAVSDNIDLTKTASPISLYISCQTKLTEKIVSQFFKHRGIETVQFKTFNSKKFSSGIVLLKYHFDVKRALKFSQKFLINGSPLRIKRYYGRKAQKESRSMKGKIQQKQKNNAFKKKLANGPSKNNSSKKQLKTGNKSKRDMNKGQISNVCVSQNMLNPLNLPETDTISSTEFANGSVYSQHMDQNFSTQSDTMQNVDQVEIHPDEEVDYRKHSDLDSSYVRSQRHRNVYRQSSNRQHRQSNNNHFSNNCDNRSYEKFKMQLSRQWSNHGFDNTQNQPRNQRRDTY